MAGWRDAPVVDAAVRDQLRADLDPEDFVLIHDALAADIRQRVGELEAALAGGDAEAGRRAVHSLKGAALNLGHLRLGLLCAELNQLALAGDWAAVAAGKTALSAAAADSLAALGHAGLALGADSAIVRH